MSDIRAQQPEIPADKGRPGQRANQERFGQVLVQGVEQFIAPDQGAPERSFARAVAPDQHPLRHDGQDRSRERAAQVEGREEQQRVQEV